jgi:hypothetical protein
VAICGALSEAAPVTFRARFFLANSRVETGATLFSRAESVTGEPATRGGAAQCRTYRCKKSREIGGGSPLRSRMSLPSDTLRCPALLGTQRECSTRPQARPEWQKRPRVTREIDAILRHAARECEYGANTGSEVLT